MRPRDKFSKFFDFIQGYGWGIPIFALGMLFSMVLLAGRGWVVAFSALGTLGAAFAAFWSVIHSINVQRKRDDLEDEARKPRLEVKLVTPERDRDDRFTAQHRFSFINLSQQAIYIGYVYKFDVASNDYSTISMLSSVDFDVLIPAFMIGHSPIVKAASPVEAGDYEYFFYFNCASTGPLFYRLRLPLKVRQYNIKMIEFNMSKQYVEGPVEPPPGFSKFAMSVPDADNQ